MVNNSSNDIGTTIVVSMLTTVVTIFVLMGFLYLLNFKQLIQTTATPTQATSTTANTSSNGVSSQDTETTNENSTQNTGDKSEDDTKQEESDPKTDKTDAETKKDETKQELPPLSYDLKDLPVKVTFSARPFDYKLDELKAMAKQCETDTSEDHLNEILDLFLDSQKVIYRFAYTDTSQEPNYYELSAIPNKAQYKNLEDFKADFDQCFDGGDAYPKLVSPDWLVFTGSCNNSLVNNKIDTPKGCQLISETLATSLKLY